MYELKKIGKVFTSKFVGTGPLSYKKKNLPGRGLTKVEKHWPNRCYVLICLEGLWMLSETRLRSIFALVISRRQVWAVIATLTSSVVCSYVSSSRSLFSCQERKGQAPVKGRSCAVASARRVLLPMPSLCKVSGHCR